MKKYIFCSLFLFFVSCNAQKSAADAQEHFVSNGKLYAALFQQQAAEYDALCYQAYNIARLRLDEALAKPSDKPLAIVSDIDETFMNTSYYAVECGRNGTEFEYKTWEEWTTKAEATPLAGAVEFFQYAAQKGVQIFYVTNRKESERKGTTLNIKRYHFPFQGDDHLIFRTAERSKENRRLNIARNYNIVLFLGDNLGDFDKDFDATTPEGRSQAVEKNYKQFGTKYIVLPNTSYGDWENVLYGENPLTLKERKELILKTLKEKPTK
ncbi:5'-nucleotidase, lipoprotein e(P4) family [Capnocytophaga granulosa]|uniref:5'-nucleotidase, lipoprotein e(P4) family n=1 Tax=Capnocytophaga granulosa TaxID=45242 RepID=UPI003607B620